MDYKIKFTKDAKYEYINIINVITSRYGQNYLKKFYIEISGKINNLMTFPRMYPVYKIKKNIYHKIIILKYCLIYIVDDETKTVLVISINSVKSNNY